MFLLGGKAPPDPPVFYSDRSIGRIGRSVGSVDRSIGRSVDRSIGRPAGSVFSKISKKSHFGVFLAKKSYKIAFLGYF